MHMRGPCRKGGPHGVVVAAAAAAVGSRRHRDLEPAPAGPGQSCRRRGPRRAGLRVLGGGDDEHGGAARHGDALDGDVLCRDARLHGERGEAAEHLAREVVQVVRERLDLGAGRVRAQGAALGGEGGSATAGCSASAWVAHTSALADVSWPVGEWFC